MRRVQGLCLAIVTLGAVLVPWHLKAQPVSKPAAIKELSSDELQKHVQWVDDSLRQMRTIRPGMTRAQLLEVFAPESGLSSPSTGSYVYKGCSYFKVGVRFRLIHPSSGSQPAEAGPNDVIISLSPYYLDVPQAD
jgi:hypothetical protein